MNLLAQFKLLYNNVNSGKSPGLTTTEIYAFLTLALDEFVRRYFSDKGNKYQEGFDDSAIRLADFSNLVCTEEAELTSFDLDLPHLHPNGYLVKLDTRHSFHKEEEFVDDGDYTGEGYLCIGPITLSAGLTITADLGSREVQDVGLIYLYNETIGEAITLLDTLIEETVTSDGDYYIEYDNSGALRPLNKLTYYVTSNTGVNTDSIYIVINEWVSAKRAVKINGTDTIKDIQFLVTPISYMEFKRLMRKPFKLPLKSEAWRLLNNLIHNIEIVLPIKPYIAQGEELPELKYCVRYVRKPADVTSLDSDDLEIDPILHYELVLRAVELAKASYNGDISAQVAVGQSSGTNLGYVTS